MKNEVLKDYLVKDKVDIDKIVDDFYGYTYIIAKNSSSAAITSEDIEEIISDAFLAIWKNSNKLPETTVIKPYLAGIVKNIIKNKYRKTKIDFSITNCEENIIDNCHIEEIAEQKERDKMIQDTLQKLKDTEYKIFIMFYYESKNIKEIAKILNLSISNVKTILYRVRKIIKKDLENGGYSYGE